MGRRFDTLSYSRDASVVDRWCPRKPGAGLPGIAAYPGGAKEVSRAPRT
jgi:hypothetical protein